LPLLATSFVHGEHELPYLAVLDLEMHIQPNGIIWLEISNCIPCMESESSLLKKKRRRKEEEKRKEKTSYNVFIYLKQCHLMLKVCCLCCPLICYSLDKEAITVIQSI
jgi:hypothetical protein